MNHRSVTAAVLLIACCLVTGFVPGIRRGPFRAAPKSTFAMQSVTEENAALLLVNEGTDMGDIKEPIHETKEGENDFGGGQKFKMLMEMARAKQEGSASPSPATAGTAATTTTATTTATTTTTPENSQAQTLPPGWETAIDPTSGKTYYYNHALGESSWELPPMPASVSNEHVETNGVQESNEESLVSDSIADEASGWEATIDPSSGKTYYYNHALGESSWELPAALKTSSSSLTEDTLEEIHVTNEAASQKTVIDEIEIKEEKIEKVEQGTASKDEFLENIMNQISKLNPTEEVVQNESKEEKLTKVEPRSEVDADFPGDPRPCSDDLRLAASELDATKVSALIEEGFELDEAATESAFWAAVKSVNRAEAQDKALSGDVPRMLHHVFDADLRHLLRREKITTNVTCMQPSESGLTTQGMNYIFDDSAAKDLDLTEGRRCEGGTCCDACSRNVFPTFATNGETDLEAFPELGYLTFNELEFVAAGTIMHFVRMIERVRRTIAHEYGLPLSLILPLQAYSRKYVAGTTQQGGGGGEGDFVTLHTDEATHDGYHYSCVIYLSTQGQDFEGGNFIFNDPADAADIEDLEEELELKPGESLADQIRNHGRAFTPFQPTRGAAVIFSSGWENMHEVDKITSGVRYAVPCFFTTCPVPDAAYTQMAVGKPTSDEGIADDWLHLLLAHRKENAGEAMGRVKELLMKWHYLCTPLSEH